MRRGVTDPGPGPDPCSPNKFDPQHQTNPVESTAQAEFGPTLTALMTPIPLTNAGVARMLAKFVSPRVSAHVAPQHMIRPAVVRAQLRSSVAMTAVKRALPPARVGGTPVPTPAPTAPKRFDPQQTS